ncbi:carboxypeptidase regulatory-like domain-containing protein [Natribaculum luteum]|uniref:Carboxypeptidase regulatory-like domain-containing protein n=1 Tax=Natribaculum luteum TaxID=1586232 RepID=A0ABD5P507_9EURY|nr:hypothetical protein [Natribaculum luteum]
MRLQHPFADDDRAIEGLPIRLVIALVVGVASLGIMMNMLSGLGGLSSTEVDVDADPVTIDADTDTTVTLTVLGDDGQAVEDATVIVMGGSARLDGTPQGETNEDGEVGLKLEPELAHGQRTGTLEVEVVPPTDSDYVDDQGNNEIVVVEN